MKDIDLLAYHLAKIQTIFTNEHNQSWIQFEKKSFNVAQF